MAGLPCEACQESMIVIPSAVVVTDGTGHTIYRRYRTCINAACELYLIKRETREVVVPLAPTAPVLPCEMHMLRRLNLRPRTADHQKPLAIDWRG